MRHLELLLRLRREDGTTVRLHVLAREVAYV